MAARIVINPKCFKDDRDCLCVAFNERFRIAMEQYGFEPQSEPTDKQRRFFADTAYADDEVQLRRTILARILTLDTSVKDPTDEQLQEAVAFLQEFKRRERPSNDWEASAIDRLEVLVQTVVNKGRRAVPKPQGGTVQADIGGGTTEDDEENRQQTQEPEEPEETAEPEEPTDTQEPIEEATPPTETAEPEQPTEQPTEPATEQPSTEPQVATTEPPSPENLEPGQVITNNGTVTTEEEAQRQADEFKRSLLGDTDNSQDAAITEEPKKPEEASQPPQTQTAQQPAQQTQQTAQQQTQTQTQTTPAAPSTTVPQPVHTEGQQPAPGARWTTKSQRKMRRYLRALYGKDYAYAAVYGASAKAPTVQSPAAKPVRATPRRRT